MPGNIPKLIPALALLAVAALGVTLAGLDGIDFVRQSECRTAVVAREMLDSGDFLVPTVNGRPRFEKPPLYYWAIAAAAAGGEVSETVARLPSVLSALTAALALGGFAWRRARHLGQPPAAAGWLAGLLLICLPGFWQRATLADAESMLALACLAVTACLYWNLRRPRHCHENRSGLIPPLPLGEGRGEGNDHAANAIPCRVGHSRHDRLLLWAYVLSAAAFMVKGPIFLFFTWPAYLWLARRELKGQGRWHGLGLLLFLAGAAAWYAAVLWLDPHSLEVFRNELAMRFDSHEATHPQPVWFYLGQLFESTLPLGLFVPVAVYAAWKRRGDKAEALLLGNAAVAFAALTVLKTKQAHYLLPLLPWLALWLGDLAWDAGSRAWRWLAWGWLGLGGVLAAAAAVLAYGYGAPWLIPIFVLLAIAAIPAARRVGGHPLRAALVWTAALVVGGYAANEAAFTPLRGLKFEHGAYFEALRQLAATDGVALAFDDACFYYYYGLPAQKASAQAEGADYMLGADATPLGRLRNHHRGRLEWLWRRGKAEAVNRPLLSADGGGDFTPARGLSPQAPMQTACLSTEVWAGSDAALLKVAVNGACSARRLLPDLLAANDSLQGRLVPWKLLWLEAHDLPQGKLRGWLLRQVLARWAETGDAAVVLDRDRLLSQGGKHGVPLRLTPADFDDGRLSANGDILSLTRPDGATRRWRRQPDGARLALLPER